MEITTAVETALEELPDDAKTKPGREVALLLAAKLDGETTPNEAAALARELRQTLAALQGPVGPSDGWGELLGGLGGPE